MAGHVWDACLRDWPDGRDDAAVGDWVQAYAAGIARDGAALDHLLAEISADVSDLVLSLLSAVLDALRMDVENGERDAPDLLGHVADWAEATGPEFGVPEKMALCQAYVRAGLAPPDALRLSDDDTDGMEMAGEMPDPGDLLENLLPDDITGHAAYTVVREAMAPMPDDTAAAFVTHLAMSHVAGHGALACFFLLDPLPHLAEGAASGLSTLAKSDQIDAALLTDLIRIRKWLPESLARATLDRAIRDALRREASGGSAPRPWRVHRVLTSLPDGTGSQSIVTSVSRGSEKRMGMLMLKAGHGIKDAYAMPCASATEQREMLARLEDSITLHEVPLDYARGALGQGLADQLPPAPGFLELAQMLGLDDLAPSPALPAREIADPDGIIAALSAQKRGRLITDSLHWPGFHDMAQSWFVTNAQLSDALETARSDRQAEKAVWEVLETQRDGWARLFARVAEVLRHADDPDWRSFAAVVHGLETGRALKKIPIFEHGVSCV